MLFLLCQFVNFLEVTRLPIYYPSDKEKDNPKLYADNMRQLMAREVLKVKYAAVRFMHTNSNCTIIF